MTQTPTSTTQSAREILFNYINYRGEPSHRRVRPISIRFGASEYHTKPQWLMLAVDLAKNEEREFAMDDMSNIVPDKALALATPAAGYEAGEMREAIPSVDTIASIIYEAANPTMKWSYLYPSHNQLHASVRQRYIEAAARFEDEFAAALAALPAPSEAIPVGTQPVPPGFNFPYNPTFQAIAAAVEIRGEHTMGVSVQKFEEKFNQLNVSTPLVLGGDDIQTKSHNKSSGHTLSAESKSGIDASIILQRVQEELRSMFLAEHSRFGAIHADKNVNDVSRSWHGGRVSGIAAVRMLIQRQVEAAALPATPTDGDSSRSVDGVATGCSLREALQHYADTYCEGWCERSGDCAKFDHDCGGCKARSALYATSGHDGSEAKSEIEEARDHLGAALIQATACDDQIILDHIKAAHELLRDAVRNSRPPQVAK